ncbi:MAG: ATP-binding cassette domain-containing protein [Gemmatimonadetes bacterium]|nr:ATP-binding cassette domain-containing protein [Gemmatimonadota bacterium]
MTERIRVQDLAKTFLGAKGEEIRAVDGVSFVCREGEVFGLLGLNGAGKTTTLRMLSTVLTPTAGTALVNGHDIASDPQAVRESIGFLSGTTGLYPRLTAEETLRFFGEFHGLEGDRLDSAVERVLETFGITKYRTQRCEKLSTGMKQKVNIGRAVVHDPPVLILDEPTSGLDVLAAATTLEFVESCRAEGKCVLFSTHIMSEVERLCDRVAIIHEGSVRASGTMAELRERTGQRYPEEVFRAVVGNVE